MATILVVDDELGIRALLSKFWATKDTLSKSLKTPPRPSLARTMSKPDLVLLDIWMPDVDGGVTLLWKWSANGQLTMPVIMMSGHGTIDTAVEATKFGAQSFLEKPITMQKLRGRARPDQTRPRAANSQYVGHVHMATVTPITARS